MAVELAAAYVPIIPEFGGVKGQITKGLSGAVPAAQVTGRSMGSRMGSAIKSTLKTAAVGIGVGAGAAVGAAVVGGFKSAVAQQDAKKVLSGLYGSAKGAKEVMADLKRVAGNSPIDYSAYLKAAQGLAYAGVKGDDAAKSLKNVGLAITAVGGTSEDMQGATDAVLKMVNAGKVTLDTVQQLSNTGVPIISGLAKHFGVSIDKVNKMASEGKIGLNDVLAVMKNGTGATFQSMIQAGNKASKSFGNQWKIAKDRVFTAVGTAMLPLLEKLAPVVGKAGTAVAGFATKVGKWLNGLDYSSWNGFLKSLKLGSAFKSIKTSLTTLQPAFNSFVNTLPSLGAAGSKLAAAGLDLVVKGLQFLAKHVDTIIKYMPLLVAGFIAWRVAQRGLLAVQALSVPLMTVNNVLRLAAAKRELQLSIATRANTVATSQNNVAQRAGVLARGRAAIATGLQKAKLVAATVATKAATVAQRALNLAMRLNPIGIIITAITALVAGLVWFFTKTKLGQKIVSAAWAKIKVGIAFVVNWFKNTALPFLQKAWRVIGIGARVLFAKFIRPAWRGIKLAIALVWGWISKILWPGIKRVFDGIGRVFRWLWNKVAKPVFKFIGLIIKAWWLGVKIIFRAVVKFVKGPLTAGFRFIRDKVVKPVFRVIGDTISGFWTAGKKIFQAVVDFIRGALTSGFRFLRDKVVKPVFKGLKDAISGAWGFIRDKVFKPLDKFITKTIPNAFKIGVKGIKGWWSDLKNIAKKPVKFMVETVYNKGIRGVFNKVMDFVGSDVRLPKLRVKGFRRGGYTGDGPEHQAAGIVHKGEYVLTKKQVKAAGGHQAVGAAANGGRGFAPIWGGFQNSIRRAGRLFVGTGAGSAWQIPAAASMWDRLAGLRVRAGRGSPQATTGTGPLGSILAWATGSGNITFNTGGLAPGLSRMAKRATAAHEIGHVLGLPHTMGASIMQPTIGKYMSPTSMDKRRLESLYGPGSRAPGGGGFNPLAWVADKVVGAIKGLLDKIPGAGKFLDLAVATAKHLFGKIKDWAIAKVTGSGGDPRDKGTSTGTNKFGAKVFDKGGMFAPGVGFNASKDPEPVLLPHQWKTMASIAHHSADLVKQSQQRQFPSTVRLVVDGREFTAYVDERADHAVASVGRQLDRRRR